MSITIHDVAHKAGVSASTVSRVFNNRSNISTDTRERVLSAAEDLGYQPRSYKKQESASRNNVGVIFSNRLSTLIMDSFSFYGQVMAGIEENININNYKLFLKTLSGETKDDINIINNLVKDENLAGLILIGHDIDRKTIINIKEKKIPLVLVDNNLWDENIDCVVNDNIAGARKAVAHLVELGHKNIAFLNGPLSHTSLEERFLGYQQALKEAGIKKNRELIYYCQPSFNINDGYHETLKAFRTFKEKPTALFTANDPLAIGAMKALKELNYKIPEDISVLGFDDIQMAEHTSPPLSTIKIYKNEMGALAGKRLDELIRGKNPKPIKLVVSVDLVVRESTKTKKL